MHFPFKIPKETSLAIRDLRPSLTQALIVMLRSAVGTKRVVGTIPIQTGPTWRPVPVKAQAADGPGARWEPDTHEIYVYLPSKRAAETARRAGAQISQTSVVASLMGEIAHEASHARDDLNSPHHNAIVRASDPRRFPETRSFLLSLVRTQAFIDYCLSTGASADAVEKEMARHAMLQPAVRREIDAASPDPKRRRAVLRSLAFEAWQAVQMAAMRGYDAGSVSQETYDAAFQTYVRSESERRAHLQNVVGEVRRAIRGMLPEEHERLYAALVSRRPQASAQMVDALLARSATWSENMEPFLSEEEKEDTRKKVGAFLYKYYLSMPRKPLATARSRS